MSSKKVLFSGEGLRWEPLEGAPPGVMKATIWGNTATGPYGAFVKFPKNMQAPLHNHSSEMKIVVVKGAYVYTPEGGKAQRFGPGSFVSYPGGDRHATSSDENSESLFFVEQPGKFDLNVL